MSTYPSDTEQTGISGLYYDGISSRAYQIKLRIGGGYCSVNGDGIDRVIPINEVTISEPFAGAPRLLRFRDGASCEVPDTDRLSAILKSAGRAPSLVVHLQQRWRWVAISLALLIAVFVSAYRWGLPWASEELAFRLPEAPLRLLSHQALASLDKSWLGPSNLPIERQQQLRERFSRVTFPAGKHADTVAFRDGGQLGPNAFALPDGTIVFFDRLVQIADSDDQLVAVFAHEAGHAAYRHGVRQMIQSSVVAFVLASYIGDVSTLAGALSGMLLEAKYSRDFERDADAFAAEVLKQNHLSPMLLGTFLTKLEKEQEKRGGDSEGREIWDYLSSHPATEERMKELEVLSKP
jgi:Zn-dependent protease with chaperone function